MMTPLLVVKWSALKSGQLVVMSDPELDELCDHFKDHDGPDADLFFGYCGSAPNPKRVGTLDTYLVFVGEAKTLLPNQALVMARAA